MKQLSILLVFTYSLVLTSGSWAQLLPIPSSESVLYAGRYGSIYAIQPNGTVTTFASGFSEVSGMAFGSDGILYAASYRDGKLYKITPTGSVSQFAEGLNGPTGLAFGGDGLLYVSQRGDSSIVKVSQTGFTETFAEGLGGFGLFGIAFDNSGNLFAANNGDNNIWKINPQGQKEIFASGEGLMNCAGIAFDQSGNLFVANWGYLPCSISKVTAEGAVSTFATGGDGTSSTLSAPVGLAFGANGDLYAANYAWQAQNSIMSIDQSGNVQNFVTGVGGTDRGDGEMNWIAFSVPEPSTYALLLLSGAASLWALKRRKS
jgi:hypothetical protein